MNIFTQADSQGREGGRAVRKGKVLSRSTFVSFLRKGAPNMLSTTKG